MLTYFEDLAQIIIQHMAACSETQHAERREKRARTVLFLRPRDARSSSILLVLCLLRADCSTDVVMVVCTRAGDTESHPLFHPCFAISFSVTRFPSTSLAGIGGKVVDDFFFLPFCCMYIYQALAAFAKEFIYWAGGDNEKDFFNPTVL